MIPSDPKYGGPDPQIAKGEVNPDEDITDAAIREVEEELGLVKSNIISYFLGYNQEQKSKKGTSKFFVYGINIFDPNNFIDPHWETGSTLWLSENEISTKLRKDHKIPVYNIIHHIKTRGG